MPVDPLDVELIDIPASSGAIQFSQKYMNFKMHGMSDVTLHDTQ